MATSENRLARWATSTKHLVGTVLALGGPALAIAGVVSAPIGIALAVPLYAIGALVAPNRRRRPALAGDVGEEEVLDRLDDLEKRIRGRVPDAVASRVHRIATTIRETLPRADGLGAGSQQLHTLVQTATDYLPEAVDAYLRLPRSYADHHVASAGKTPLQLLTDQLDLLASKMDEVFVAVNQADTDALIAHGRFLDEKFAPGSLDLGPGPTSTRE
ncbi:MAG TPA: hypothetical protein VKD67_00895 [Acidimicrobiales bacterium]|nr:hypothetical protein [Acidimicrobiales bacterium]